MSALEVHRGISVSSALGVLRGSRHMLRHNSVRADIGTRDRRTSPIGWVQQVSPLGRAASGTLACAGAAGLLAGSISELTVPAPQAKMLCRC